MTNKHTILKNRVIDFSFKKKIDQSTFNLVEVLNNEVITIINNNLLKRPSTTTSYLKSIITDLKWALEFLLNHISNPIQKKLYNKEDLTELEHHNFENGKELYWSIMEIIQLIEMEIQKVQPQQNNSTVEPFPEKRVELNQNVHLNDSWKKFVIAGGKLSQPEIALLCWYEGIIIPKPASKIQTEIANNLALWHGHTSGHALYNNYDEIADKTKRLTNRKAKTMRKYLKNIMPLISQTNLESINKDLQELPDN